jgi:hypothetical protein
MPRSPELNRIPRESYTKYLTLVRAGATPATALATACRVRPKRWYDWFNQGHKDSDAGKRSAYRAFYDDSVHAMCEARTAAEIQVRQTDPLKYLTRGAGKRIWHPDHPEDSWKDDIELSIQAAVNHAGRIEHADDSVERPAPVEHLAHAFALLAEMGLGPAKLLREETASV